MIVVGIDASTTRCGFAVMDDRRSRDKSLRLVEYFSMQFKKELHKARRRNVRTEVRRLVYKWAPDFVVLEQLFVGRAGKISALTIIRLAAMWGTIVDASKTDVVQVHIPTWKRTILGSGRADKRASVAYVDRTYGLSVTHDLADAICLAEYGLRGDRKVEAVE